MSHHGGAAWYVEVILVAVGAIVDDRRGAREGPSWL
jgi:hypothetical protein